MKKTLFKVLKFIPAILIFLFILSLSFSITEMVPDHAIVYIDTKANIYYTPLSLTQEKINELGLRKSTLSEVHALEGYKPNPEDRDDGNFIQRDISIFRYILENIGILRDPGDIVDTEGNWYTH